MFPLIFTTLIATFILYSFYKTLKRKLIKPTFKNKIIWITGASSGIGQYLVYQFNKLEAHTIISARNIKQLQRVKQACAFPERVRIVQLDMTDFKQIQEVSLRVIGELESNGERLDVLVQNAGVSMRCLFKDYSFENHLSLQDVNVHGPFRHIQCCLDHMIKNKNGHIVGVTSLSGKLPTSHRSSYSASKSAFIGIMDSLRSQLYSSNITVTNIMPGYVSTNLSKNAFGGGRDEKLGFTDSNIKNGLPADVFARTAARAIYNKENELQISKPGIMVPFGLFIRNVVPEFFMHLMKKNAKSQIEALKNRS